MSTVPNHALRQLRAGKLAIGLGINLARTVPITQLAKTAGFDWLFIDCEHSSMDLDMAAQISAASLAVGVSPIVRVAGFDCASQSRGRSRAESTGPLVFRHGSWQVDARPRCVGI